IWNPQTRAFPGGEAATADSSLEASSSRKEPEEVVSPYGTNYSNLAGAVERRAGRAPAEWLFIVISLVAAALGIFSALVFYVWRPGLPSVWAARLRPLYLASYHKYWIDELYGKLFTRRTMDASRGVYAFDSRVVDGAVNGAAALGRA